MTIWTSLGVPGPSWHDQAKCLAADPSLFFPEKGGNAYSEAQMAKDVCNGADGGAVCAARAACLEWALSNNEKFGVWGGLSERERRGFRRERALKRATEASRQAERAATPVRRSG